MRGAHRIGYCHPVLLGYRRDVITKRTCLAAVAVGLALASAGCAQPAARAAGQPDTVASSAAFPASPSAPPSPAPASPSPSPSAKPKPKPTTTLKKNVGPGGDVPKGGASPTPINDGTPALGAGTFTVAPGGTAVVGTGSTLVTYRVELEDGIAWGANPVWTPDSFASTVDGVLAGPRSWIAAAAAPITDAAQHQTNASWAFQRVDASVASYGVRVRLATPGTVDKLCGAVGVHTQGVYSCRYGNTIMINLRRWLHGAPGFPISLAEYHDNVINHEMGHFLGFAHMLCPGAGQPAPIMMTQTISLGGCVPNSYPFRADGVFVTGPWASS